MSVTTAPATAARYNALTSAPMLPGCCFLCRNTVSTKRPAVDLAVSQPKLGRLYICTVCAQEIVKALGLVVVDPNEMEEESKPAAEPLTADELKKVVDDLYHNFNERLNNLVSLIYADFDVLNNEVRPENESGSRGKSKRATEVTEQDDDLIGDEGPTGVSAGNNSGLDFPIV